MRRTLRLATLLLITITPGEVARGDGPAFSVAAVLTDENALNRPHDVELQGELAFVPGKGGSIAVIDVSRPDNPKIVWYRRDPRALFEAETVLPLDDYLLLGTDDLASLDVRDLRAPRFVGRASDPPRIRRINGMVKWGDHVFAACKHGWVGAFDVSQPESPSLVGALNTREHGGLDSPHDLDRFGDCLVVVDPAGFGRRELPGQVGLYRVADPNTHEPIPADAWELVGLVESEELVGANRVQVRGAYAFVGASRSDAPGHAVVVALADPARPVQVASLPFSDGRGPNGLVIAGDVLFLAGGQTVEAVDISHPTKPAKLASYQCPEAFGAGRDSAHDLVYRDGHLYVTGQNDHSFCVLRVEGHSIRKLADEKRGEPPETRF